MLLFGNITITLDDNSSYVSGKVSATITYDGDFIYNAKIGYGTSEDGAKTNAEETLLTEDTETGEYLATISFETTGEQTYYIYAYGEDENGNSIYITKAISNIDNVNPEITSAIATNKNILLTAEDSKSGIVGYAVTTSNSQPNKYTTVSATNKLEVTISDLTQKTEYYVWVIDGAGNVTSTKVTTEKISYTTNPTTWTNDTVTVTFTGIDNCTLTYNIDGGTTQSYNTETGIIVSSNCTITYYLQDQSTTISDDIKIENIDKTAPTVNAVSDYHKVTLTATDSESGITGYYVTDSEVTDTSKITFTSCTNTNNLTEEITTDHLGVDLVYNTTYYIYVTDAVGNVSLTELISKMDIINPSINISALTSKTESITVTVTASDNESGLSGTYNYYISDTEGKFSDTPDYTGIETTYSFTKLTTNMTYYIKIVTTDNAENEISVETNKATTLLEYIDGTIDFNYIEWTNNTQTITLSTSTNYSMQYQIVDENGTLSLDSSDWIDYTSGEEITELIHGQTVYARLSDGTNVTKECATYNVINEMYKNHPSLTESEYINATYNNTSNTAYDVLTYDTSESSTTVSTSKSISNAFTYNYYIKDVQSDEYEFAKTTSSYDEQLALDLESGETYKVVCMVLNTSGSITKCNGFSMVIAEEESIAGSFSNNNLTYIDSNYYTATIPAGFTVSTVSSEQTISTGLVIKDENNNEFVWIPSLYTIYDETTTIPGSSSSTAIYKPMVRYQSGSTSYYESFYYSYSSGKSYITSANLSSSNYRLGGTLYIEPSIITGNNAFDGYTWNMQTTGIAGTRYDASSAYYSSILGFSSTKEMGEYLNSTYTNMVEAVEQFGGFYVGRYETTKDSDGTIGSKANTSIYNLSNWYSLYLAQDSTRNSENPYYGSSSVVSTMIHSSQYDEMLNFLASTSDASNLTSTNIGNMSDSLSTSGQYLDDKIGNIYDLSANVYEYTVGSYGTYYRVTRGGGYESTASNSVATKNAITPDDGGLILGSRMALYLKATNDLKAPTINSVTLEPSSTLITVTVEAVDKGTGIAYYTYSISSDGKTWEDSITVADNTYTFTGLNPETTYYIRASATDNSENTCEWVEDNTTTTVINLEEGDIYLKSIYGASGSGVAVLAMLEDYENAGYKIAYVVLDSAVPFDENNVTWTEEDVITNLNDSDVIYATLTDGTTYLDTYLVINLNGLLEEYEYLEDGDKTSETTTVKYTDSDGNVAYIPAGFKVGTSSTVNTIDNGLVIEDENGNQFVWVPVKDVIYDESTTIGSSTGYFPMARYQSGNSSYYEMIWYSYSSTTVTASLSCKLGTGNYREPSLIASSLNTWNASGYSDIMTYDTVSSQYNTILGFSSYCEFGVYMNEEYTNMINSVQKFGGFYIARTETSVSGTTVQSQIGQTAYSNGAWYYYYLYQDSNRYENNPYYDSTSVVSSMVTGSQWDAMINWILQGDYAELASSLDVGNHGKTKEETGTNADDIMNNILDLGGNVTEWTQTASSNYTRIARGGYYSNSSISASGIKTNDPMLTSGTIGTRMSLYLVDETDETAPEIELATTTTEEDGIEITTENIYVGTNYINIEINVTEAGSGIDEYHYYISTDGENYTENIAYTNDYTYTGLTQNTTYYIKIQVSDKAGNYSNTIERTKLTEVLSVQTGDIVLDATYGADGNGVAYFVISEELEESGYIVQYAKNVDITSQNISWTEGQQVNNLSVGDVIYVQITDGVNTDSSCILAYTVSELETFSEPYKETTLYEDENGDQAYIPAGFKVGTSSINKTIESGLVIEDEDGNQYVWVPVEYAIYSSDDGTYPTNSTNGTAIDEEGLIGYKPMAKYQNRI